MRDDSMMKEQMMEKMMEKMMDDKMMSMMTQDDERKDDGQDDGKKNVGALLLISPYLQIEKRRTITFIQQKV